MPFSDFHHSHTHSIIHTTHCRGLPLHSHASHFIISATKPLHMHIQHSRKYPCRAIIQHIIFPPLHFSHTFTHMHHSNIHHQKSSLPWLSLHIPSENPLHCTCIPFSFNPHASQLNKPHACTFPFCHAPIIPENHSSHHSMWFQLLFVYAVHFDTLSRLSFQQPIHMHDSTKIAKCMHTSLVPCIHYLRNPSIPAHLCISISHVQIQDPIWMLAATFLPIKLGTLHTSRKTIDSQQKLVPWGRALHKSIHSIHHSSICRNVDHKPPLPWLSLTIQTPSFHFHHSSSISIIPQSIQHTNNIP